MADDCPNCATLENKVSQLTGGIGSTIALILAQLEKPTMNRHQLVLRVKEQLHDVMAGDY